MGSLYSEQRSWLHGLPAGLKLLLVLLLSALLYQVHNPLLLAGLALGCALLCASLGGALRPVRRLLWSLLLAAVLLLGFHTLLGQWQLGLLSVLRLLGSSLLGLALTVSTRAGALLAVLEWLLAPLQRLGLRSERLGLQLALMLRFVEHFFVVWQRLDDAHRLRTGRAGGLRLLAPLTIAMLQAARRVADTLENRIGA